MESHLKWADYLILIGFLAISLAIGIYHSLTGGRQKTIAEFILANRKLKVIPTAISLLVSFHSAVLFLGSTAEMYSYGIQTVIFECIATALAMFFIERIIVPWVYPLKLVSVYDYLEMRFMSKSIRILAASMGIVTGVLYMGMAMYAPSAALESVSGLPLVVSIPVMAAVSVAYTALGGMRAVIWTDVFQFLIMIGGMVTIVVKGLLLVGGISNVFIIAGAEGRLAWANPSFDPRERHTVWGLSIGVAIATICGFGLPQVAMQRISAVDRLSKARTMVLLSIPPTILMNVLVGIIALVVLAHYSTLKCDPIVNKDIANHNLLLPHFVVTVFAYSTGFAGLFLATLYGAALSTVSSVLSGSAANCWEDILKWKLNHLPEARKALINRMLIVVFGALATAVGFLSAYVRGPVTQGMLSMCTAIVGPVFAVFVLGAASRHANWKGTLFGFIFGIIVIIWLCIGSLTVDVDYALPPVSVEQCNKGNTSHDYISSSPSYTNYTTFEIPDGTRHKENWNETADDHPRATRHLSELRGLENFYAISYLWYLPLGAAITGLVGIIASLITRNRDMEAKVDERLLIHFYGCGWTDESENQERPPVYKDKTSSPMETTNEGKAVLNQTENRFHEKINGDSRKNGGVDLLWKDDPRDERTSRF